MVLPLSVNIRQQKPESLGDGWEKDDSKGITKQFRLFGLTNSVPVYERQIRQNETECGGGVLGVLSLALYSRADGAQLKFDYLTPYI